MADNPKLQVDKFKEAARELDTDDDPERFAEKVRQLAKAKPASAEKPKKPKGGDRVGNG
ncbi:hypothetical protein IHQ68_02280 [Chelatococcus sambhunathii]|uniref:Uncharacterized protein n=1 Tax=Chelatococcus sambhunathii TaxID=363953 RepID=A0ABU1DC00_9HYPH|nr:hypothetical protein [Chelatococcus sambhunathii]MDR4305450.1 hypothetical protein [Chelatococcus sambhunathii]